MTSRPPSERIRKALGMLKSSYDARYPASPVPLWDLRVPGVHPKTIRAIEARGWVVRLSFLSTLDRVDANYDPVVYRPCFALTRSGVEAAKEWGRNEPDS